MNLDIYIVGAGTYGEAMYELATILGYNVIGFYDDDESKQGLKIMGIPVIGKSSDLSDEKIMGNNFIVAIGNNDLRLKFMLKIINLGGETPTLIHPTAIISPSVQIGNGVYIQANAYLWTKVKVNDFCIISPNVVIAHHTTIGEACLISTMTAVGASIKIKDRVFVGMGSTIVTGISLIGENTTVGAGAVVLKNLEANSVYAGVPAKKLK